MHADRLRGRIYVKQLAFIARIGYNTDVNCLFLYNPSSGKGKVARKIGYIRRRLDKIFDHAEIAATSSAEDLESRVREGAGKFDVILFSGGDGTFNHVLQGVGTREVRLGYIPGGTTNDVARSLGIPRTIRGALNVIERGYCEQVDCMRVNDRYAMYIAAAGAFTRTTYITPQSAKKKLGILAYAFECLKNEMDFKVFPLRINCDGVCQESHAVLIFVLNGRSVASFPINRSSSMQDGRLELVVIKQAERPGFFRRIGAYFSLASLFLFGVKVKKKDILYLRGRHITVSTDDGVVWDLDGEEGMRGNIAVEVLPQRMRLFVPRNKKI